MPLMKSPSKKAFSKNVETEMKHGKPLDQSLAISYSIKRKSKKKMAAGGRVHTGPGGRPATEDTHGPTGPTNYQNRNKSSDLSGGQRRGPEGYPKYQEQAQNEKGVHTPVSGVTGFPGGKGTSRAGDFVKDRYAGKPTFEAGADHPARKEHARVMEESKKIKPKLQGLAEGGMIDKKSATTAQRGPKTSAIKHPRMVPSSVFSTRLRDEEDHLESSDAPASPKEQPPRHDDEEGPNRQGSAPHKMKMMAEGGKINKLEPFSKAEDDMEEHPAGLESDNDSMSPSEDEIMADHMQLLAEGGMAEQSMDHEDSVAAAIMAKRDRMHAMIDSGAMDMDHAVHGYAEGGEVDLETSHDEEPNNEDQMSFEALKKENYNDTDLNIDIPEDSGEHGHEIDSDDNDKIDQMRRKVMAKRQFKAR